MKPQCQDKNDPPTLREMLRIALGTKGYINEMNIAILYSVIKSILKKLNCEDEVVTITGVRSKELQELLCNANACPLPCDERIKVLTEKLKNLDSLENHITEMEIKLEKHLAVKFSTSENVKPDLEEEHTTEHAETTTPAITMKKIFHFQTPSRSQLHIRQIKSGRISFDDGMLSRYSRERRSDASDLRRTKSVISVFSQTAFATIDSTLTIEDDNDAMLAEDAECLAVKVKDLKESFSDFKRRVEDNDGWWEFTNKCGEASTVPSTVEEIKPAEEHVVETEDVELEMKIEVENSISEASKKTLDNCICYIPCEDVFTIPSPENVLPRALLRNLPFMQQLQENTLAPFKRRMRCIESRLKPLMANLYNWIKEIEKRSFDMNSYDMVFNNIADLSYFVASNKIVVKETLAGMQEIFDLKVDKYEIIPIKREFSNMLEIAESNTAQVRKELAQLKAAAFVFQTEAEKQKVLYENLKANKKPKTHVCNLERCCNYNFNEPKLLQRIERFTYDDLSLMRERQTYSSKLIRLTNSSNILSVMVKKLNSKSEARSFDYTKV